MPNLMESAASGSTAARTMQQNMFGGQYDQQNAAAQAQEQQLKVQQEQANVEKTKLANIVADSGIQVTKQKTEAINKLTKSDGWGAMNSEEQSESIIKALLPIDPADAEKMSNAAATAEYRKSLARMKQMDAARESLSSADSALAVVPLDRVEQTFKDLPPENQKTIIDKAGEENWKNYTPAEKQKFVHNLFLGTIGKLKEAGYAMQLEKQDKIDENRVAVAEISAKWHLQTKHGGITGTKDELATYKAYTGAAAKNEAEYRSARKDLDKEVAVAEADVAKGRLGGWVGASQSKIDTRDVVVAKRLKLEKDSLQRDINLATILPPSNFRTNTLAMLEERGKHLGLDENEEETPKPTATKTPSREASGKVGDPAQEAKALAWAKANPNDPRAVKYLKEKAGGGGGTPTPAPTAAPTAPAAAPKPTLDEATLVDMKKTQDKEMGAGKRMDYTPEVKEYVKKLRDKKALEDEAASKAYRDKQFQQSKVLRGY